MQLELYQELRKHVIDPIQSDSRFSELVLAIETVPDIAHSAIVLGNAAQGIIHKCYDGLLDAHSALSLYIDSIDVASLQAMHTLDPAWLEAPWGGGGVKISRCIVTSLMSGGRMSCFITYHTISSAVQYP